MMSDRWMPDNCDVAQWLRERATGHAPGYDISVYARPHRWIEIADELMALRAGDAAKDARIAELEVGWTNCRGALKDALELADKDAATARAEIEALRGQHANLLREHEFQRQEIEALRVQRSEWYENWSCEGGLRQRAEADAVSLRAEIEDLRKRVGEIDKQREDFFWGKRHAEERAEQAEAQLAALKKETDRG